MENCDIYGDLEQFNVKEKIDKIEEEKNELSKTVENLENTLEKFTLEITELRNVKNNLEKNISELYKTAKAEIQRKDKQIEELRSQLDSVPFHKQNPKSQDGYLRKKVEILTKENELLNQNAIKVKDYVELRTELNKLKDGMKSKEEIIQDLNKKLDNLTNDNNLIKRSATEHEKETLKRKASRSDDEHDVKLRKLNVEFPRDRLRKLDRVTRRSLSKSPDLEHYDSLSSRQKRERNDNYTRREANNRSRYYNDRYNRHDRRNNYYSNKYSKNLSDDDDDKFRRTNFRGSDRYWKRPNYERSSTKQSAESRTYDSEDKEDSDYIRRKSSGSGVSPEPISDNDNIEYEEQSSSKTRSDSRVPTFESNNDFEEKSDYQKRLRRILEDNGRAKNSYRDRKEYRKDLIRNRQYGTCVELNLKEEDGRSKGNRFIGTNDHKRHLTENDLENKNLDNSSRIANNIENCKNLDHKERRENSSKIKGDNNKRTMYSHDDLSDNYKKERQMRCNDFDCKRQSNSNETKNDGRKLIENEFVHNSVDDIESLERKKLELEKQLQEEVDCSLSRLEDIKTCETSDNSPKSAVVSLGNPAVCSSTNVQNDYHESNNSDFEDCLEILTSPLSVEAVDNDCLIVDVKTTLKPSNNLKKSKVSTTDNSRTKTLKIVDKLKRLDSFKNNPDYKLQNNVGKIPVVNSTIVQEQKEANVLKFASQENQEKLHNFESKLLLGKESEVSEREGNISVSNRDEAKQYVKEVTGNDQLINQVTENDQLINQEIPKNSVRELEERLSTVEPFLENATVLKQSSEETKTHKHQNLYDALEKEHNLKDNKNSSLQSQELLQAVELHIPEKEETVLIKHCTEESKLQYQDKVTHIIGNEVGKEQYQDLLDITEAQILEKGIDKQQRTEESKLPHSAELQTGVISEQGVEEFQSQDQQQIRFENTALQNEQANTFSSDNNKIKSQLHKTTNRKCKEDIFPEHSGESEYINDSLSIKELSSIFEADYVIFNKTSTPSEKKLETNVQNAPIIPTQTECANESINENELEKSNNSAKNTDESAVSSSSETKHLQKKQSKGRRRCVITIT